MHASLGSSPISLDLRPPRRRRRGARVAASFALAANLLLVLLVALAITQVAARLV